MHPRQKFEDGPGWIKFPAMDAEARGSRISMMIVVPALAGGEQCDKAEIGRGIIKIALAKGMVCAIDHGIQENINAGLNEECEYSPEWPEKSHENSDADEDANNSEPEEVSVEPIVSNVRGEFRERLRILCLAVIVIDVS